MFGLPLLWAVGEYIFCERSDELHSDLISEMEAGMLAIGYALTYIFLPLIIFGFFLLAPITFDQSVVISSTFESCGQRLRI